MLSLDQQDVEAVLEATCGAGGDTGGCSSLWGVHSSTCNLAHVPSWQQTPIIVCLKYTSLLLHVKLQMRCESRPAFLNAYLRRLRQTYDVIGV